jgi:kynurenine formamidase
LGQSVFRHCPHCFRSAIIYFPHEISLRKINGIALCTRSFTNLAANAPPFTKGKWIDLTHEFAADTLYWPTAQRFTLESEFHGQTPKGYFYAANRYSASEHGGTHIDAPIHFAEGRKTVDELSIDQLTGPAVVVDVSAKADKDADYQIAVADVKAWEEKHGRVPNGAILLFHTGFARHWPNAKKYSEPMRKDPRRWRNSIFRAAPDAARWLTSERNIKAVGLDTAVLTMVSQLCLRAIASCLRKTFRRSKTSPTSTNCRQPALT